MGSINEEQESDSNSAKIQQQSSTTTTQSQKSGKEGSKGHKPPFSGLKKLIDRDKDSKDKDKDKDKDDEGKEKKKDKEKVEKELSKAASVIKSGLNDTKENMKKLIGKDKQSSKASLQQSSNYHDETSTNNGDVKSSPLVLMKLSNDVLTSVDGGTATELSIMNSEAVICNNNNNNNNNGSATHGIISPFDSFNSDSESSVDHPHHQLSTSSDASVNILMDNNTKSLGNVQVSQV